MRALIQHRFGPTGEVLAVEEVDPPRPGPGQIRVRMLLASIHNHDLMTVEGQYGFRPELPARAGTEAVGIVEELGEGVTGLRVGQRVAAGAFGVWADEYVTAAAGAMPVPDEISDEAAAQLVSMPMSALTLLDDLAAQPGQWIVQNAANGTVGRFVAQLGAARGIRVLGLVRRSDAVADLAEEGIGDVVATDQDGWRRAARAIIGDGTVVSAVDSVGGAATADLAGLLSDGGELVAFGAMGSTDLHVPIAPVLFRRVTVRGFWGATAVPALDPAVRAAHLREIVQRVREGDLALPVDSVYDLEQIAEAVAASRTPGRVGKVLLRGSAR